MLAELLIGTAAVLAHAHEDSPPAAPPASEPLRLGLLLPQGPWADRVAAGAELAAAELDASGGVDGRALQVVRMTTPGAWRGGAGQVARLVVDEDLVALIGASGRAEAHQAAQVATRLRVPLISLCPDESLTRAGDPWVFRAVPDDRAQARALLAHARATRARLMVPADRGGRARAASLRAACAELGVHVQEPGDPCDAVLLWLDPARARELIQRGGLPAGAAILGSSRLERADLPRDLPRDAGPLFLARTGAGDLDPGFVLGRDSVRSIAHAARTGGPTSDGIRRGLLDAGDPDQVTPAMTFDRAGNRRGPTVINVHCESTD